MAVLEILTIPDPRLKHKSSKVDDFDKKLALNENVDIVTVPLSVGTHLGSGLPDTSSSSTGANKVPTFSTSDYANNFPTITESMFNVSTV